MEDLTTHWTALFAQLGLDNSEAAIADFIARHRPLPGELDLHQAPFWTPAQALLLRELKDQDTHWSLLVDRLDLALR